jgi:histone H3/H4
MVEKRVFSLYEIEQFIKEAGAEKVTEDAVRDLEREIEKLANTITKKAIRYAEHAGRTKLIRTSDVLLTKEMGSDYHYKTPESLSSSASTTNPPSRSVR